jgi:glycosyltransferase involved in cell wall biosynthesis
MPGGVDAVVSSLARGLARCPGVDVHVVTATPGLTKPREYHENGCTIHATPRPAGGRLTGQRQVVRNLCDELDRLAPDVAHAHIAGVHARAALEAGLPSVVTLHGIIRKEMQQAWRFSSWSMRARWLADARFEDHVVVDAREIISISPYILEQFHSRTQARFHAVENPVNDLFFSVAPPPGRDRLLCVARIIPRKGIATLIRAFAQVAAVRPAAHLKIVGETKSEPMYAAQCQALVKELDVSGRVEFLGALRPAELARQYTDCDLFVLASEQETAPVSIAEAMAASRPVVTTDAGGCAAMLADGLCGTAVPLSDPAATATAFAGAIVDLLSDPAQLQRMGKAAHEQAQVRFRLDSVVAQTLAVYEEVRAAAAKGTVQ